MLSLLEVEKVNQKNVIKTQNTQGVSEGESGGFAEIFNFLNLDKNAKKSDGNSKKIVQNARESSQNQSFNKLSKNENPSSILKSLDEKYNLSKNFLETQKTQSQSKSVKVNIPNNSRVSLPTPTTLKSARDLLEFSKSQKQEAKTLKDLSAVANDLKLNIQKISLQKGEESQNKNIKNFLVKQEISPAKQLLSSNESIRIGKEVNLQTAQKTKQESPNILSNLLQDKELIDKQSHQTSKVTQVKTDLKDSKIQTQSKESLDKNAMKNDKKEEKVLESSKGFENKVSQKEKVESQTETKTSQTETLETKGKFQKTESKTLQDSKEKTEKVLNKEQSKPTESTQTKVTQVKTDLKDSKIQTQSKESLDKNAMKNDKKEEKVLESSKGFENKVSQKEKVESQTETKTSQTETLETKGKFQKTESKTLQDSKEKTEKVLNKEQSKPTESTQTKVQDKISQKTTKESQEILRQESFKQDSMEREEVKQENIVQEKVVKEAVNKESQSLKTTNQMKLTQDFIQNPFASKEKKEVKDSFVKEDKEDKRNIKNPKASTTQNTNNLSALLKEESMRQEMKQQDIFLDNLLKTTEKSTQTPKEALKGAVKEVSKGNQEKSKINQEIFQTTSQAQVENRFSVQNTFLHFSDKLREALQNYRPPITKLSLELNPENLGSVELTITKRGDNISVQISSNPNALQLFMQNAQEFKNSLSNLGLNDVNLEFKDSGGNSLGNGDFGSSNGGENGGFQEQNRRGNAHKEQEFEQNSDENSKNAQKWNGNSLHIYKEVNNPYAKVALVEINFSYYA